MAAKLKKGDKVIVISGKDKGASGGIVKVLPSERKVVVQGVNLKHKHKRPSTRGEVGSKLRIEAPIDVSNVAYFDEKTNNWGRVGFRIGDDGKKVRFLKKTGETING